MGRHAPVNEPAVAVDGNLFCLRERKVSIKNRLPTKRSDPKKEKGCAVLGDTDGARHTATATAEATRGGQVRSPFFRPPRGGIGVGARGHFGG